MTLGGREDFEGRAFCFFVWTSFLLYRGKWKAIFGSLEFAATTACRNGRNCQKNAIIAGIYSKIKPGAS
jgi:hypothetical protein